MSDEQNRTDARLVDELDDALTEMYQVANPPDRDVGVFLAQSIGLHADEATLRKIIADVREFAQRWREAV